MIKTEELSISVGSYTCDCGKYKGSVPVSHNRAPETMTPVPTTVTKPGTYA